MQLERIQPQEGVLFNQILPFHLAIAAALFSILKVILWGLLSHAMPLAAPLGLDYLFPLRMQSMP